ncbi:DNA polymerase III subunit gamma/tau [Candidatus Dojkabacteria bacterium]|nr:DNA polymerase III subunit gamma/tau [Candidatus Dojkabacteria bacterium]
MKKTYPKDMPKVLYNKYRSSDFDQLVGQEHITKTLKNAVKTGKISHAYLFVGSRGTGKTSTARILAKSLNCKKVKKDGNPCSECENCLAISQGRFLDLIEIDAASNRGIDQIRELKERIEFSPVEGRYKIYIIDEVHMLTKEAFNALLKTLEEPPAHVIFILATTDVHKLPATILSRCQRYDFKLGTEKEIAQTIEMVAKGEGVKLDKGAVKLLVENANGSYRDALSLLDVVVSGQLNSEKPEEVIESEVRKVLGIPDTTMVYHLLDNLIYGNTLKSLELIEELESKGINFQQFVKYILSMLQDILIKKIRGDWRDDEYSFANKMTSNDVSQLINIFLGVDRNLRFAVIPSLVLEMTIPQVCGMFEFDKKEVRNEKHGVPRDEKEQKVGKTGKQESKKKEKIDKIEPIKNKEEAEEKSSISFVQITKNWNKVIEEIKPANGHLFAFLGGAKLISFEKGVLKLEVPYEFHKERIESVGGRDAINEVFRRLFKSGVKIVCDVNGDVKGKTQVSADVVLQNVIKPQEKTKSAFKVSKKIEAVFAGM